MAFIIQLADLKTHIYTDVLNEIVRDDNTIAEEALATAIDEAKSYCSRYDLDKLFGTPSTNATVTDANLKSKLKDLARWHICKLSNVNIEADVAKAAYDDAIKWFNTVAAGKSAPAGWPYRDTTTLPALPEGNEISYSSNPKRSNHY